MSRLVPIGWRFSFYGPAERRNRYKRGRAGATLLMAVIACVLVPRARATSVDWSKAQLLTITTVEYAVEPNHLILHPQTAYRLHVENHGRELHELTAPDFFKAVELRNPEALNREHTEIVLQPNEQKDHYFVTLRSGHYDMWCADHDWAGMTGDITIE
jgi:plastocyanin